MPRRPLEQISVNIPREEELTSYIRSKIVTLYEEGTEIRIILDRLNISKSTIKKTIKTDSYRTKDKSLSRTKRPRKYTKRDK